MENPTRKPIIDLSDFEQTIHKMVNDRQEHSKSDKEHKEQLKIKKTIKLSKEQFVFLIGQIEAMNEMISDTENQLGKVFDDFFGLLKIRHFVNSLSDWVSEQMGDDTTEFYGTMIDWYLFEACDFDEEDKCITFTKPEPAMKIMVRNAEELYDYFVENARRD